MNIIVAVTFTVCLSKKRVIHTFPSNSALFNICSDDLCKLSKNV